MRWLSASTSVNSGTTAARISGLSSATWPAPHLCNRSPNDFPDQYSPRTDHGQVRLRFRAPMTHRTQKQWIDAGQASQRPRVHPVILSFALSDQTHVPRVGDDHFVTELLQLPAHPRRVTSDL